jgi:hypothetical protein
VVVWLRMSVPRLRLEHPFRPDPRPLIDHLRTHLHGVEASCSILAPRGTLASRSLQNILFRTYTVAKIQDLLDDDKWLETTAVAIFGTVDPADWDCKTTLKLRYDLK